MEFRHLESFLAIAEELHFGRAAARLHLAQPSLSQQLQRLERSVGTELVARTSHEVRLTPAGKVFREQARAIVAQAHKAAQTAREAAAGRSGTINVGYNFAAGQHVLPAVLSKMYAEHPNVGVMLHEMRTGPQLQALRAGEVDVAMVYGRAVGAEFECRPLSRFPLVAVVGPNHKWADRPGASFSELAHEPCILFRRDQCPAMYDAIHGAASSSDITLNVEYEIDDPGAVAIVASVKPVIGFASAVRGRQIGGSVRTVPVRLYDPVPTIDLYVVWKRGRANPLIELFLDCVESRAAVPGEEPVQV
ncbi:LysR family transcriptional regulator [Saccharopolyspora indica]|uniref:LysR family transcriptional regulator n=1 Tax=Saccharopolyspora indica TaxID=1229659 RepID=UPI0022EA666C|nr:LysR family transcriptional regulator [Saccharopolyspora indica]MDA3648390.1 LysR family transcriptional regulator [Saccharopolyspora indica]